MYNISRRGFMQSSIVLTTGLSLGLSGCGGAGDPQKNARFAVLSDPHVYDTSLGTSGTAFESYLAYDRKMLVQSTEILEAIAEDLLNVSGLDFVLVPGDLTKDGELVCHEKFVSIMSALTERNIRVYVVPGNHDVNNPHAVSFDGGSTIPVETVTPDEFAEIYDDFGYGEALYRDSSSLSYIAEVADNVWLFAIDSCKYDDNETHPETSGHISSETLSWILSMLTTAREEGKKVIGMLHHGITSHFAAQTTFFPEYVVDEYMTLGETLANAGLNIFFTGHFHAQDIVRAEFSASELYDVETGSCVTSPCPYRIVDHDIPNSAFTIESRTVSSIPSMDDFETYKTDFITSGMLALYEYMLPGYGIDTSVAPAASEIHIAHYAGNEPGVAGLSASSAAMINAMLASSDPDTLQLGYALADWATDTTEDNDTDINL